MCHFVMSLQRVQHIHPPHMSAAALCCPLNRFLGLKELAAIFISWHFLVFLGWGSSMDGVSGERFRFTAGSPLNSAVLQDRVDHESRYGNRSIGRPYWVVLLEVVRTTMALPQYSRGPTPTIRPGTTFCFLTDFFLLR